MSRGKVPSSISPVFLKSQNGPLLLPSFSAIIHYCIVDVALFTHSPTMKQITERNRIEAEVLAFELDVPAVSFLHSKKNVSLFGSDPTFQI
jgi:hypothetical protein